MLGYEVTITPTTNLRAGLLSKPRRGFSTECNGPAISTAAQTGDSFLSPKLPEREHRG